MAATKTMTSWKQEANLGGGDVRGAGCTSREPLGRFCSFFAGKQIWQSIVDLLKFITLGLISWILEGFCITMATLSDFLNILFQEDDPWPVRPLPTKFRSDPPRNGSGVRGRGHKDCCFYCMISRKTPPPAPLHIFSRTPPPPYIILG